MFVFRVCHHTQPTNSILTFQGLKDSGRIVTRNDRDFLTNVGFLQLQRELDENSADTSFAEQSCQTVLLEWPKRKDRYWKSLMIQHLLGALTVPNSGI